MRLWERVEIVTAPTEWAVTRDEVKLRQVVEHTAHDAMIDAVIAEASAEIDGPDGWGIALTEQVWQKTLDAFPAVIELPGWPVKPASAVIKYDDADGAEQTLAAAQYRLDAGREPAVVALVAGAAWPATKAHSGAVRVEYTVGKPSAGVSQALKAALHLLVGHRYRHRNIAHTGMGLTEIPVGYRNLRAQYLRTGLVG